MEPQNRKSPDEIDLLYFFQPLINALRRLNKSFTQYLYTLKRNAAVFFAIFFLVSLVGFLLRYFLPGYYKTNAVFVSYNLPAEYYSIMIGNLQALTKDRANAPLLAAQLHISSNDAATIKSLSTDSVKRLPVDSATSVYGHNDTTVSAFRVNLVVRSMAGIAKIQEGLKYFLENNDYAVKRKEARRRTLEALKNDLIVKGRGLDSLKQLVNASIVPRSNGQGIILGEPISPVDVYRLQEMYYRQQLQIEERLSLLQNVDIVQPFYIINASNYPDFNEWFIYAVLAGLLLSLLLTPVIGKR